MLTCFFPFPFGNRIQILKTQTIYFDICVLEYLIWRLKLRKIIRLSIDEYTNKKHEIAPNLEWKVRMYKATVYFFSCILVIQCQYRKIAEIRYTTTFFIILFSKRKKWKKEANIRKGCFSNSMFGLHVYTCVYVYAILYAACIRFVRTWRFLMHYKAKELKTYFKQETAVLAEVSDIKGAAIQWNIKRKAREKEREKNCNRNKIAFS